jgi:peroxiredoxin Q/BCP
VAKLLKEDARAPSFSTVDQDGKPVSLKDFAGRRVVLYFYPKDDTPGCTTEACAFRDNLPKFKKLGVDVLGVSVDDEKSHAKFSAKFGLPFRLLADPDKTIVRAYGVWGEKSMYGRTYMGTHRVTYLIDGQGRIEAVWPKVKPAAHAEEVLARLRQQN